MRLRLPSQKSYPVQTLPTIFRTVGLCLLSTLFFSIAVAQKKIFPKPLSERIANYDITVKLDDKKKTLDGKETLTWRNTSNNTLNELQFHMYLNAFKDANSTFMKESNGGKLRENRMDASKKDNWGNVSISSFTSRNGENLLSKIEYFQPDDLNENDKTVFRVRLNKPLQPGETIVLDITFTAKLPKIFARTGFAGNYFLVGQWFPKIGVYESAGERYSTNGQWNCHQFHANTEFYADFGNYDVKIDVPRKFVIGATGVLQSETKLKNDRKLVRFYAEDVHDFAWTASPEFLVFERQKGTITLRALMQPEHAYQVGRYFDAAEASIDYFQKHVGSYPYPILTMVDPPIDGSGSGGMEYPTFITCGTMWGIGKWAKFQELVTVHEFGHQYFQGMLASNEFEESWLDEGVNQYMEGRIMDETYGEGSQFSLLGFTVGDVASSRQSYVSMTNPKISEVFRNAWQYPEGAYSIMTYTKTATWMRTLDNLVGRKVMDEILRTYYLRWRFKHPSANDFIAIVNEIVPEKTGMQFGPNMDWYFDQVLYRAPVCDYFVDSLSATSVVIGNAGDMYLPTGVEVVFEDGSVQLIRWDGKGKKQTFTFKKNVVSVTIDPGTKNLLDLNVLNNSKSRQPDQGFFVKFGAKMLFWTQTALQLVLG